MIFKAEEWAPGTFDMDSLALQVVPDPKGTYSLSKYTNIMGTPGLTAFVGLEGIIEGQKVWSSTIVLLIFNIYCASHREKLCSYLRVLLVWGGMFQS